MASASNMLKKKKKTKLPAIRWCIMEKMRCFANQGQRLSSRTGCSEQFLQTTHPCPSLSRNSLKLTGRQAEDAPWRQWQEEAGGERGGGRRGTAWPLQLRRQEEFGVRRLMTQHCCSAPPLYRASAEPGIIFLNLSSKKNHPTPNQQINSKTLQAPFVCTKQCSSWLNCRIPGSNRF